MSTKTANKSGYKKTKLGWIPEDWEVLRIGDLLEFKNGLNKGKEYFGSGTPIINYMDVFKNRGIETRHVKGLVSVNESELERYSAKKGDVFFTRTSETINEIGYAACLVDDIQNAVFSGFILRARAINNKADMFFKKYCFASYNTRKEIITKSSYTTRALTNGTLLSEVLIPLPPLVEQKKIAEILSTWDKAIEITQSNIKKLQVQKKGFMQQLLTGKKRLAGFKDEWKETELSQFIKITLRATQKPNKPYLALGLKSHGKGVFHKPKFDPTSILMDTLYEVKENDLVINITFAWEHAIAVASKKDEGGLVSHRFPTYTFIPNKSNAQFFKYYFLQKKFKYLLGIISPGGAGRNRVMSKKDFPKLKVKVPTFKEQIAIAQILSKADEEITHTQQYLKVLQQQKKGLMQQLLTGQKRVKLS